MQTNAILLQEITLEQLVLLIGTSVKSGIQEFQNDLQTKNKSEELLSREETCKFLKIDSSTLWAWTNASKVKLASPVFVLWKKLAELKSINLHFF